MVKIEVMLTEENARQIQRTDVAIVNELLTQFFTGVAELPENRLENRPDWQEMIEESRVDYSKGNVIPHQDVLDWNSLDDWSTTATKQIRQMPVSVQKRDSRSHPEDPFLSHVVPSRGCG